MRELRSGAHARRVPGWGLSLIAVAILVAVVLLIGWLDRQDTRDRVFGRPARLGPGDPESAARPFAEIHLDINAWPAEGPRPAEGPPQAGGPILSLETIARAPRPEALIGRTVLLDRARVLKVVGDTTFWIGEEGGPRLPAVLRAERMGRQPEGRVELRAGQQVRILGTLRRLHSVDALDEGLLNAAERQELEREPIYLSAEQVIVRGE